MSREHSVEFSSFMTKYVPTIFQKESYLNEGWYQSFQLESCYEQQLPKVDHESAVQAPVPKDDSFDREYG